MPTVRIACDVNAAEEMELERLDEKMCAFACIFEVSRFPAQQAALGKGM